jgi:hypothetical protein
MQPDLMKLHSATRSESLRAGNVRLLALAGVASLACGVLVTKSPLAAAAVVVIAASMALVLTRPALVFAAGIALLAVEPAKIFGTEAFAGRSETYKLLLYACFLPLLFKRSVVPRKCAPLVAYAAVTVLSEAFGSPLPHLTVSQTAASLATLSLGWLVFAINWEWNRDQWLLKLLAWVPVLSVVASILLQGAGILPVFRNTSPPRLEGATIAAWLGSFSVCAVLACLTLYRRQHWKLARWLGLVDVVILGATLTRGAIVALAIIAIPSVFRFGKRQLTAGSTASLARLFVALSLVIVGVAILAPRLQERNENATVLVKGQGAHEIASGRFRAWAFAYEEAKANLAFGRGIGAGPIVGRSPGSPVGFTAQHNEYVRMLLEVGFVGGLVLLIAMTMTIGSLVRRAPPMVRADLAAGGVALAVYSITENTLSATPIAVAFLLVFGIAGSRSSPALAHRTRQRITRRLAT